MAGKIRLNPQNISMSIDQKSCIEKRILQVKTGLFGNISIPSAQLALATLGKSGISKE